MSETIKKKRISKRHKSAWRKTDVQDVDDFLEEQRQKERVGTFTDKSDEALFTVDATPQKTKKTILTEKQKRKLNAKKPLRSWQALENRSKVQDPIAKRNHVKLKKSGRIIEEEIRHPTKPRHFQANKDRQQFYAKKEEKAKENKDLNTAKDIWQEEDFRDNIPGLKDEKGWVTRDLALHVTKNIGKPVIKTHDSIRHRTTKAKKFEAPHPGTSYNPSLEDHQALINEVVVKEEKIIKEKKHLKRVTTDMFKKVTPEERDKRQRLELCAEMDEDNSELAEEKVEVDNANSANDEDNEPYTTLNPPVENKKKSKKARRKELQQKQLQKKKQEQKLLKKQIADLHRIKSIKAEVTAEEEELNALKKRRKQAALKKKFEPKRLGRLKYEDPDIDVNMPEDISGNLRNVKTESSLVVDRIKNFQKRNILPVSVATGKQKARKIKRFPRSSHKDPGVSFQMLRAQRKTAQKK